ncbi:MAG: NO-inducible flavohemoprotein [Bacillaceae bacterium]
MLSENTIAIIKSTVPILEVHGLVITETFYRTMFKRNPEVKNYFNQSNQKDGKQPLALAQTVLAAAKNIDKLHTLGPAIIHIGQKHRSLHITPALYNIVGENLLIAIKEVLGNAATDEIMNAWAEAYGAIAEAFIAMENELVRQTLQTGGWEGYMPVKVVKVEEECDNIKSFYLEPLMKKALPNHLPGQYISILVDIPNLSYKQPRQYSLSMIPKSEYYRISVKKEEKGVVSSLLHTNWKEGDILNIAAPAGTFVYEANEEKPVVFIAGGIGITPLLSMLYEAKNSNRPIQFVHCVENGHIHPFKQEVQNIAEGCPNVATTTFYANPLENDQYDVSGLITKEWIANNIAKNADVYICGPTGFMKFVVETCYEQGMNKENIRYEMFGPNVGF